MGTFTPNKLQLLLDVDLSDLGSLSGPIKLVYDDVAEKWKAAADTGGGGTGGGGFLPDYANGVSVPVDWSGLGLQIEAGGAGGTASQRFTPQSPTKWTQVVVTVELFAGASAAAAAEVDLSVDPDGSYMSTDFLVLTGAVGESLRRPLTALVPPGKDYIVEVYVDPGAGVQFHGLVEIPAL